jgi:hypothetical protein
VKLAGRIALIVATCTGTAAIIAIIVFLVAVQNSAAPLKVKFSATGSFRPNGEYPTTTAMGRSARWGSWSGSDAFTGTLQSSSFPAPLAISIDVAGGTSRENQHIDAVGPDGSSNLSFTTSTDAGEVYTTVTRILPRSWWGKPILIRARDTGGGVRGWIAVTNPRAASASDVAKQPLYTFTRFPWLYTFLIVVCLAILTLTAFRVPASFEPWSRNDTAFLGAVTLVFSWLRWPFNIDEAQTTAQAMKAAYDIVPWRGFDGGSGGPLGSYVLAIPNLVGITPSLISTHVIGTLLLLITATGLYAAGRALWGSRLGACVTLCYVTLEALNREDDFLHTSGELLPNALLAFALFALAAMYAKREDARKLTMPMLAGFTIGAMPFAKLQSLPSAAVLALAGVALLSMSRERDRLAAFCAAAMAVPIVLIGAAAIGGSGLDFYRSYIVANIVYTGANGSGDEIPFLTNGSARVALFLRGALVFLAIVAIWSCIRRKRFGKNACASLLFLTALFLMTAYEAAASHRNYNHYLVLMAPAGSMLIGALASIAVSSSGLMTDVPPLATAAMVALTTITFVIPGAWRSVSQQPDVLIRDIMQNTGPMDDPMTLAIHALVKPKTRILVWGWNPEVYVRCTCIMATRDATTYFQIVPSSVNAYYRLRLLRDFARTPPVLVIDDVRPHAFALAADPKTQSIESFPELDAIIKHKYVLKATIDGARLFERRSTGSRL